MKAVLFIAAGTKAANLFKRLLFPRQSEKGKAGYADYAERVRAALFLLQSYQCLVRGWSVRRAVYRDLQAIYRRVRLLTGLSVEYMISHCFGAAFDLDTAYEVEFVRNNYREMDRMRNHYYMEKKYCIIIWKKSIALRVMRYEPAPYRPGKTVGAAGPGCRPL